LTSGGFRIVSDTLVNNKSKAATMLIIVRGLYW